jgi:FMN phosphatase YigB (HAD superfamily)
LPDLSSIRAVLFDLDGTLYPIPRFMKLRATLILWDGIPYLRRLGKARDSLRNREFPSLEALNQAFYDELARRAGREPRQAAAWFEQRFVPGLATFLKRSCRARPGLVACVAGLRQRGIKVGVFSDYGCLALRLSALGLDPALFDLLSAAEDFGALKPLAKGFEATAGKLALPPESVLMIGDRDDLDGEGARRCGMPFVGVLSPAAPKDSPHFYPWPDLLEMLERIGK